METVSIPKQEYEELLLKAKELASLKETGETTSFKEINEDYFDDKEVKEEYLEKLERIRKEEGIRFSSISELREHIAKNA